MDHPKRTERRNDDEELGDRYAVAKYLAGSGTITTGTLKLSSYYCVPSRRCLRGIHHCALMAIMAFTCSPFILTSTCPLGTMMTPRS
jgi:hypothetical protein